jgi:hypothetical protein
MCTYKQDCLLMIIQNVGFVATWIVSNFFLHTYTVLYWTKLLLCTTLPHCAPREQVPFLHYWTMHTSCSGTLCTAEPRFFCEQLKQTHFMHIVSTTEPRSPHAALIYDHLLLNQATTEPRSRCQPVKYTFWILPAERYFVQHRTKLTLFTTEAWQLCTPLKHRQ